MTSHGGSILFVGDGEIRDAGIELPEIAVPEIMNARQLADYLGFEEKTIRNWTSEGTVPYRKVGGSRAIEIRD